MNIDEAINSLKKLRESKQTEQFDNTSNAFAKSLNTFKNIIVGVLCDLTSMLLKNEPSVTVKNIASNKKIEKQLKQINDNLLLLLKEIKSHKRED